MTFILRLAAREMRASWKRLLFFFLCVAIGVGAIVALRSVIQSVRVGLTSQAKALTAGDVVLQSNRPWTDSVRATIEQRLAAAPVQARTNVIETATMVRPADESKAVAKMVELEAIEAGFPLYGDVVLEGGSPYSYAMLADRGVLVRPELLTQLGVAVGDQVVIGGQLFTIRGVITSEPGRRPGAFSFGPRVIVRTEDLIATGLLGFGSRATYRMLLKVQDAAVDPLVRQLRTDVADRFVNVRSYRGTEDRIGRDLLRAENYLSLVGFVIVLLGGIGVWSVTRVFVQQKIRSIAVLKCLGAGTRTILAAYLLQVLALALAGSLFGVALAALAVAVVPQPVVALAGVSYGLTVSATLQGIGVGILVCLLFALVPLLEVRHVKPLLLLRHETGRGNPRRMAADMWRGRVTSRLRDLDWIRVTSIALVVAALVALAVWQAASLRVGLYVSLGFVGVAVALHLAGLLLVRLIAPLSATSWFPVRHAVMNLSRPGNQTRVILLAVGLGTFFILGVRGLEANLLRELRIELRPDAPDMFMIDIQADQREGLEALVGTVGTGPARFIPVLRARVTGVRGQELNLDGFEDVRGRGSLGREYVITYRDDLEANERVVGGRFWKGAPDQGPEVSIEESIHERFRINVGDTVRFDILGRPFSAKVTSIRRVEWGDVRTGGFMFLFRPSALATAPHTYIATLRGPTAVDARARLQRDVVVRYPNVSIVDIREVIRTVESVLGNVTLAISVVGLVALFTGTLILIGSVALTKFQRLYEAAIFRTLGATTRSLATMLLFEYATLGSLAGLIGAAGGLLLSWAVSKFLLEIPWTASIGQSLAGIVITAALVATVGVVSSVDVIRRKPLSTLRAE